MAEWITRISDVGSVYQLSQSEMQNNAENVLAILNGQLGWSLTAVAGVLGNMQSESTINPGACEEPRGIPRTGSLYYGGGLGLIQWTDFPAYQQQFVHPLLWYADQVSGSWWDGTLQCNLVNLADDFSVTSCGTGQSRWGWLSSNTYPMSFSDFKVYTGTPEEAAVIWLYNLERGGYNTAEIRKSRARYWYDYLQGMSPDPPDPPPPTPPTPPVPSRESKGMPVWMMCRRPYLGER